MTCLRLFGLSLLFLPAAVAQEAGERLWTVDVASVDVGSNVYMSQPRVAPDGTVYLVTDSLYTIRPDGEILWTAAGRASDIDIGPGGTVYTAAGRTIYAYHPDGTERWRFTDDGGWGITTGPTIGPDGNLYAVNIQGGLGAFSLTPDGDLRWTVPGFLTNDGGGMGRVAFGPDNMYYADDGLWLVEGCEAPYTGLVSISLDGDLEWCRPISGIYDPPVGPVATLDGRALILQLPQSGTHIRAYTPDGEVDWTQDFLPLNLGVGPDNHVYAWHGSRLVSLTADGDLRWSEIQPINNFPWRAEVAADLSAVVAGSVYGFGENGIIVAADPANGSSLWSLPVTGPSAGAGAPAAFSPDGSVVYVPVNTISLDVPDQLWAIRVQDDLATGADMNEPSAASSFTLSTPAPSPTRGRSRLTLGLGEAQPVTVAVYDALGRRVATLHDGTLAAGAHDLSVDASAWPPGVYAVRATGDRVSLARTVVVVR